MHIWMQQEREDWGGSWSQPGAPRRPRPIRGPGEYVEVVRDLARQRGVMGLPLPIDGRLIAPAYCHMSPSVLLGLASIPAPTPSARPSGWADTMPTWPAGGESQLEQWLNYWNASQERPDIVGSSYNDRPEDVWAWWRAGIPADRYPREYGHLLATGRGQGGPRRIRAILTLARRVPAREGWVPQQTSTRDLRRLARLRPAFLRWLTTGAGLPMAGGRIDWAAMAQIERGPEWQATRERAEIFRDLRIPADLWWYVQQPDTWELLQPLRAAVERGVNLDLILSVKGGWRTMLGGYGFAGTTSARWERIVKAGWAGHLAALPAAAESEWHIERLAMAARMGIVLPETVWTSWSQIREALDGAGVPHEEASPPPPAASTPEDQARRAERERAEKIRARALDRLSQRAPEWAVREWASEYTRGRRLAPLYAQILDEVRRLRAEHGTVAVHLRDGEMILQVARRAGEGHGLVPILSSRPLTTQGGGSAAHEAYLRRVLPPGRPAAHVDTGFAGSIPRWMMARGWAVAAVALVSSTPAEWQMPIHWDGARSLRDVVLEDMEHCPQRLAELRGGEWPDEGPRRIRYSEEAPGFWARLYGICDALGLPRQVRP